MLGVADSSFRPDLPILTEMPGNASVSWHPAASTFTPFRIPSHHHIFLSTSLVATTDHGRAKRDRRGPVSPLILVPWYIVTKSYLGSPSRRRRRRFGTRGRERLGRWKEYEAKTVRQITPASFASFMIQPSGQGDVGTLVEDRMTNNGWMGRFTFVPGRNVTKTHTGAGNRYIPSRRPLKRTTGLGSSSTTARGPRSMTRSS